MISSNPILLPHPDLISPHYVYHREILGRKNTKLRRWIYKINSALKATEMDLSHILPSKPSKIPHAQHCAECVISTLILHNNPNVVSASSPLYRRCNWGLERSRNLPKAAQLISGRKPGVLTPKSILFTHYHTTYYCSVDERVWTSRLSFTPWANHLTSLSSWSSVNEGNDSCPAFS